MRGGGALLLVIVGLFLLWLVITGQLDNAIAAFKGAIQDPTKAKPSSDASNLPPPGRSRASVPVFSLNDFATA